MKYERQRANERKKGKTEMHSIPNECRNGNEKKVRKQQDEQTENKKN